MLLTLKILLTLYAAQALLKFAAFFLRSYETRIGRIASGYEHDGRAIRIFDDVVLLLMLAMLALLWLTTRIEYLSFITGLVVGMTLIQTYFHRFSTPLPESRMPAPSVSPIKHMSYAIQASPGRPWRELIIMSVLLIWSLAILIADGFGAAPGLVPTGG